MCIYVFLFGRCEFVCVYEYYCRFWVDICGRSSVMWGFGLGGGDSLCSGFGLGG